MTEFVTVLTTTGSVEEARKIAQVLVSKKLAACVQMMAVNSCYMWEGKLNNDPEQLLMIKTRRDLFDQVEASIKAAHSYDTPEIICLPIMAGSPEYLGWIARTTHKTPLKACQP